jgi:hypothetical protein
MRRRNANALVEHRRRNIQMKTVGEGKTTLGENNITFR